MVRHALVSFAIASALVQSPARGADLPPDVQRSLSAYERGRSLLESGDCTHAVPLFEESIRANDSIGAHLSIAECRSAEPLAAYREYKLAEALARRKGDERARYAHDHAAALRERLARIQIVLPGPGSIARLDAKAVDDTEVVDPIAVEPGAHAVDFVHADGTLVAKRVLAVTGQTVRVTGEHDPIDRAPARVDGGTHRTLPVVVGGVGLGLAIAGGVFGFLAASKLSDAKASCPAYPHCASASAESARDANAAGRTDSLFSTIGLGVGAITLAVGVVLYFTAPHRATASGSPTRFEL